jgi:tetratricopeptide (TPR) repeat protein
MKLKLITQCSFIIAFLVASSFAFASAISSNEKNFTFDWNNYSTIAPNQTKIAKTEAFLKTVNDYSNLSASDREALGKLLYKLGTFYTHVSRQPDLAIEKMNLAAILLTDKEDKAWNDNQLAYAYEQKYAASGETADKEKALTYTNKLITETYPNTKNKEVAFAYCVKGLIFNDAKDFSQAETNYKTALNIYEKIPGGKDDQYARAKNRLANIILEQNGREKEALGMLKQLKSYWAAKGNIQKNPYAARNLIALGEAYLKTGEVQTARDELNIATNIYKNVYGNSSKLLAHPYQLLSEAYIKTGNAEQASIYKEKVYDLDNS